MKDKYKVILGCFGIGAITFLETINLLTSGIDGTVLAGVCTGIGSIVGALVGKKVEERKRNK